MFSDQCPPGFYSTTGVAPCMMCDVDTFWTDPQTCTPCGEGKGTAGMHAATSQDMCKGLYGKRGLRGKLYFTLCQLRRCRSACTFEPCHEKTKVLHK